MNELLQLLALIDESKKADAQKLVDAVKAKIESLDNEIIKKEKERNDALNNTGASQDLLKKISSKLGVDIDANNIDEALESLKSKGKNADEVLEKENQNLKQEVNDLMDKLKNIESTSQQELMKMRLKNDVAISLPKHNAKKAAYEFIISEVEKRAVYENGKVVYKNDDGTTMRLNGADASTDDIIKKMFEKEKETGESMFFNIDVQASGASNNNGGTQYEGDLILD